MVYYPRFMTNYNISYALPKPKPKQHIPYGRELTPMEKELVKRVQQGKKDRQQVIAKAQALERKAARLKAQREHAAARKYED